MVDVGKYVNIVYSLKCDKMNVPNITLILQIVLILIVAIVVHEMAHAAVSNGLGDNTAKLYNRISLNPFRHIDPFFTILLPLLLALIGLPIFGGARPVLINKRKIKYGEYGVALVALAGPLANLFLSFISFAVMALAIGSNTGWLFNFMLLSLKINLNFFLFNILPFPPLDGSRLLYAFAPDLVQNIMDKIERYGFIILFSLIWLVQSLLENYLIRGSELFVKFYQLLFGVL